MKSKADCWMMENYELFQCVCVLYKIFMNFIFISIFPLKWSSTFPTEDSSLLGTHKIKN